MSRRAYITIQVMPFSAGGHAAVGGPMIQLRFPEGLLPDLVDQEQLDSAIYLNKPAETVRYWDILNTVATGRCRPSRAWTMLRRLADLI